jgi:hypothetical protein
VKFEEVLPAFRKGRKIRRKGWHEKSVFDTASFIYSGDFLKEDWETVKEKVPHYHGLIKIQTNKLIVTDRTYKSIEDIEQDFNNHGIKCEVLRLLTDIPELIEYREVEND